MKKAYLLITVVLSCALACLAGGPSNSPTFTSTNFGVGNGPAGLVPIDILGNGHPGLAVANFGFRYGGAFATGGGTGTTISLLTNNGVGVLSLAATLTVGSEPSFLATADVNGDGWMDLVSANVGGDSLTVLTNTHQGGLAVAATLAVGHAPAWVTAADVNGDGKVDLISANYQDATLTILTNDGRGNFALSATVLVGSYPSAVVAADVYGNGKLDLVCANGGDSTLLVLTNRGGGVFASNAVISIPTGTGNLATADVDGNGSVDLISTSGSSTVTILTNNGRGLFSIKSTVLTPYAAEQITPADFNGDGKVDLVCPDNGNIAPGYVCVLTNDGLGNFSILATLGVGNPTSDNYPNFTTAADFTGDGNMGFAVSCFGSALVSEFTQSNATVRPVVAITSPTNQDVLAAGKAFTIDATASSSSKIAAVDFYIDSVLVGSDDTAPFKYTAKANSVAGGAHTLQAKATDSAGAVGWSPQVAASFTSTGNSVKGAAPEVTLLTPTNGAAFTTSQAITVKISSQSALSEVELYVDGQQLQATASPPYTMQLAAGTLAAGAHAVQVVAIARDGAGGSSAVNNITVNTPGASLIDFDALNTTAGAVGGPELAKYLAWYGVTLKNVTVGAAMEAVNAGGLIGTVQADPPSSPNFFTETGLNQPVTFTLKFATPLQSFGFTRVGLSASSGYVSHPQWTATAYGTNGEELSSVTENLIYSPASVPARSFVLPGNGITSVRFDSDSQNIAAFSGVLLDDLVLSVNPVTPQLSVTLSAASTNLVAPATVTLSATVSDQLSSSYYVSFYSGLNFLASATNASPQYTATNVLGGNYSLQARVTDSTGLSVESPIVPLAVQPRPGSTLVNFDALNATRQAVAGAPVKTYLAGYGISIASLSPGTELAVENQDRIAGGAALLAASPPNVLTQTGSNGPMHFTLSFTNLLSRFEFTRPELLANPFVSHPAWMVTALDGSGAVVGQLKYNALHSTTNIGARQFAFTSGGGPGIAEIEFSSQGSGLDTFNAMVLDNFILTTNGGAFPPAVSIVQPLAGQVLPSPPALEVAARASSAGGLASVTFYATSRGSAMLGVATSVPYSILWTNPPPGKYVLSAVALNNAGLSWTSAPVALTIAQPAQQFGILSQPASQTVSAGASATFTVVTTGTNGVAYQWYQNGNPLSGALGSSLVLGPPLMDSNAGAYTVTATSSGTTLTIDPAILTIVDAPVFTVPPQNQTVATGANVTLTAAASSPSPVTWQWLLNGSAIAGATNSAFNITDAQPLNSGNYSVVAANQIASAASGSAALLVEASATIPETNDTFATRAPIFPLLGAVSDSNVTATVQAGAPLPGGLPGGNSIWFTWHATFTGSISLTTLGSDFDTVMAIYTGTNLAKLKPVAANDDSGGYLTSLVTFNATEGTDYQIAVDGFQGASGRVVLGLPAGTGYRVLNPSSGDGVPVIVQQPVGKVVPPNGRAVLSVAAKSQTPFTCQWNYNGSPISGAVNATFTIDHVQPGSVGIYTVLVVNAAGSVSSEPVSVQMAAVQGGKPTATENKFLNSNNSPAPPSHALEAVDLTPYAAGGDTSGFSLSQTFSTVGATREPGEPDPCGQVGGASQWFVYTAQTSGILEINTEGSSFSTLLGVYTGSGEDFASLTEIACGYTTNYLTQGQPSIELSGVVKGMTYYIQVDGYQGANGVAQLQIGLGQPITFRILPASQLVTAGSNLTMSVAAAGSTPLTYQWQLNGVSLAGASKSIYKAPKIGGEAVGNYTVIVSNALGAVTTTPPAALTVQFAPLIVTQPADEMTALGRPTKFFVTTLGVNVRTNPFVAQWYFDGNLLPRAGKLSLNIPVTRATNAGTYYLVISNSYGAVTSSPAILTILGTPQGGEPPVPLASVHGSKAITADSSAWSPVLSGTYSGLFYPAAGAARENSGFFTATLNGTSGAFTAHILLDGGGCSFAGSFDSSGGAQCVVLRPGLAPLAVSLHVTPGAFDPEMTGTVSSAAWSANLVAILAAADTVAPSRFAILPPAGVAPVGYLAVTNNPGGAVLVNGALPDGTSIFRVAPVVKNASIPLYVPLYSGKGLFMGWVTFSQATNNALWIQPGETTGSPALLVK